MAYWVVGPRVKALAHILHYLHGVPVRKTAAILKDLTGIRLTRGAITQHALQQAGGAAKRRSKRTGAPAISRESAALPQRTRRGAHQQSGRTGPPAGSDCAQGFPLLEESKRSQSFRSLHQRAAAHPQNAAFGFGRLGHRSHQTQPLFRLSPDLANQLRFIFPRLILLQSNQCVS